MRVFPVVCPAHMLMTLLARVAQCFAKPIASTLERRRGTCRRHARRDRLPQRGRRLWSLATLVAAMACVGTLCVSRAEARPPTAYRFHLGVGFAYGERLDSGLNPYVYGVSLRGGYTFRQGFYLGALMEWYAGERERNEDGTVAARARLYAGALGVDLKMSVRVSGRLSGLFGLQYIESAASQAREPVPAQGDRFFFGPSFEMVLLLGRILYIAPGARLQFFVLGDRLSTFATFTLTLGLSL